MLAVTPFKHDVVYTCGCCFFPLCLLAFDAGGLVLLLVWKRRTRRRRRLLYFTAHDERDDNVIVNRIPLLPV
jgi:hypothetical protein